MDDYEKLAVDYEKLQYTCADLKAEADEANARAAQEAREHGRMREENRVLRLLLKKCEPMVARSMMSSYRGFPDDEKPDAVLRELRRYPPLREEEPPPDEYDCPIHGKLGGENYCARC